jgi:hypothetical protein
MTDQAVQVIITVVVGQEKQELRVCKSKVIMS